MAGHFAIVTGASSGIGFELARICAREGLDLLVVADELKIHDVARLLREEQRAGTVDAVQVDLATMEGVDAVYDATRGRSVNVLMANAGRGLGRAFFDQEWAAIRKVIETNITGTTYLLHRVGCDMRNRNQGRILITGSIAGFTPGSFQAVYNASKSYLNSLSFALREELRDTSVSVTCLMPGATETEFFARADMLDTNIGTSEKDDAAMVAKAGFDAMMKGEGDVVTGLKNKVQSAIANVTPAEALAKQHRKMAEPGSAKS
jgi:short-subunit dehydrogenase